METVYDWITVGIFAGLVVLFLQRSMEGQHDDSLAHYLIAGVGCAVANYLGNEQQDIHAIVLIVATLGFIVYFLKPIPFGRS